MRKILCIMVAFLLVLSLGVPCIAATYDYNAQINDIDGNKSYNYPISAASDAWNSYSVRQKVEMLRISDEILNEMSDESLIAAIAEYPYLVDIYLYGSSVYDGIRIARKYFSALDELLSRDSAATSMETLGVDIADAYYKRYCSRNGEAYCRDMFVCYALLDILATFSDDEVVSKLTPDLFEGMSRATRTIHGAQVVVYTFAEQHDTQDHSILDQEVVNAYGVRLISSGTCRYNCHSYAWYSQASNNPYWINDPSPIMTVGTPVRMYSGGLGTSANSTNIRYGDIIFYGDLYGNMENWHSAIYISTEYTSGVPIASQKCRSKWGILGVFEHTMANVPSGYDIYHISAWRD